MPSFSGEILEVLNTAWEEVRRLPFACLGSEHLLLGMLQLQQQEIVSIFRPLMIESARVRAAVEQEVLPDLEKQVSCLTVEARRVWHRTVDEAVSRRQNVQPAHLLLALISCSDCRAYQVLKTFDVNLYVLLLQVLELLASLERHAADSERIASPTNRFDKFTGRARLTLTRAQEEALLLQHQCVELEHLFLGLLSAGNGTAFQVLMMSGIDLQSLELLFMRQLCSLKSAHTGLAPRSKRVIQLAVDEAFFFGHRYLGTEHLLLGMLRESEGPKPDLLTRIGLKREREVRAENLFLNSGLTVEKVRQWTRLVLASGVFDDQGLP